MSLATPTVTPQVATSGRPAIFVDIDGVLAPGNQRVRVNDLRVSDAAVDVLVYLQRATKAALVLASSRTWGAETPEDVGAWLCELLGVDTGELGGHIGTPTSRHGHNAKEAAVADWLDAACESDRLPPRWLVIDDEVGRRTPSPLSIDDRCFVLCPVYADTLAGMAMTDVRRAAQHLLGGAS